MKSLSRSNRISSVDRKADDTVTRSDSRIQVMVGLYAMQRPLNRLVSQCRPAGIEGPGDGFHAE